MKHARGVQICYRAGVRGLAGPDPTSPVVEGTAMIPGPDRFPDVPGRGGFDPEDEDPIPVEGLVDPAPVVRRDPQAPKIRAFEQKLIAGTRHEEKWARTPNLTGTGAIHVRSFHCKLTEESLAYLDQQINEWLDAHPQYEVKLVTTAVGEWTGKTREPNLIVQVWV